MKNKIAFLIQNFSRGAGSERVTALIANELSIRGYIVSIISICGDNTSYYPIENDIKLYTLVDRQALDNKKDFFLVRKRLIEHLEQNSVDLVIDVFAAMSIYTNLIKKRFGIKNITWEHYNYLNNSGMNKISRKVAIAFSDYIVTLTNTDRNYYLEKNKKVENKIDYIYNPTPFDTDSYSLSEKKKILLAVGRLTKLKGFHHLLNVWKEVEAVSEDWKLVIVGDGEEKEALQKQIEENGLKSAFLAGAHKNIGSFYKSASLLASTSDYEGLPMAMIEAQTFGLPIISFDYETGPKEIIRDGVTGFIVNAQSQEQKNMLMAQKIVELIDNAAVRQKMSWQAKKDSVRFSTSSIINKWEKTINTVLGGGK